MFEKIKKRDGRVVEFDSSKITKAIASAGNATGEFEEREAKKLTLRVLTLAHEMHYGTAPEVEEIQDVVERVLLDSPFYKSAKAYILYREQHSQLRNIATKANIDLVDNYLEKLDWKIKENSNMCYSLQGLNNYISSDVTSEYWLNRIYPPEIRQAHRDGDMHVHDLNQLSVYCVGWDLKDLLLQGFRGVEGKVESAPPRHLRTALGQLVNFIYTLQGESAGAQAVSNFDTLLAPFVRHDKLRYSEVKQAMQEFVFNANIPTRVGFQTPFFNITMDLEVPTTFRDHPVIIGGEYKNETYADYQSEMDMLNKAFAEVMMEGDATGRVFTFPIPTYNITNDFDWDNHDLDGIWEMTGKYGIPYYSNFCNSDMSPEDARSMCCRLRLDNRELIKRGGGLFGANPLTGSIGVVTINLPRIGYLSEDENDFFERLKQMILISKKSLGIKRKILENFTDRNLYPYSKFYLREIKESSGLFWKNHFSTVGIIGMNEACLNFMGKDIGTGEGQKFSIRIMNFIRNMISELQEETGDLFNLEATPAEGTSHRLAMLDKEKFPEIICADEDESCNVEVPYYTNSTQLPVNYTDDIFETLTLQDDLQTKYTGGCIEKGNKVITDKGAIKIEEIVSNFKSFSPIKALSYNPKTGQSEWDLITDAVTIDVAKHDKIKVVAERGIDITTSDWHPFFVMEKVSFDNQCPVCTEPLKNVKAFAAHLRYNQTCRKDYVKLPKYEVVEKRADELREGDYILQNAQNLLPEKSSLDPDLAYLIGFFIGDGSMSEFKDNRGGNNLTKHKVRFFSESKPVLDKTSDILNRFFDCQVKPIQNDKRSEKLLEVVTSKKSVADFLFNYQFFAGRKTYTVNIPSEVKHQLSKENFYSLLAGLIDSDGHIDERHGTIEYYTVSEKLADDIVEMCTIAGILISKRLKKVKRENEVDIYRMFIPAAQATLLKKHLPLQKAKDSIKEALSDRLKRHLPVVRVLDTSKTEVADNDFYDLTTEKNHNYLAGKDGFVFVHNTVLHIYLGEMVSDIDTVKNMIKKVATGFRLPYFTLTPTFSVCPSHGYLNGEQETCPSCLAETEVYSRVVGYLRPVKQWNKGKQAEFGKRRTFRVRTTGFETQEMKLISNFS